MLYATKLRNCKGGTNTMENQKERSKLESLFENNFQPQLPVNTIEVKVKIDLSSMFVDAARMYSMEAERVMRFTSNVLFQVTEEEFLKYFKTLLYLRVARVNNVQNETLKAYRSDMRNYLIPAFVSTLINSIGLASDNNYGFSFRPLYSIEGTDVMTPTEMWDVTRRLKTLNVEGLVCIETGIAMSPLGELAMMATLNVQGEVLGYKKDHPIYGFYASFFKHQLVDSTINASAFRIRYGSESDYRMYLTQIV